MQLLSKKIAQIQAHSRVPVQKKHNRYPTENIDLQIKCAQSYTIRVVREWPAKLAVATFLVTTEHDFLAKHFNYIGIVMILGDKTFLYPFLSLTGSFNSACDNGYDLDGV